MSDPARDGYECHGPMEPVGYLTLHMFTPDTDPRFFKPESVEAYRLAPHL